MRTERFYAGIGSRATPRPVQELMTRIAARLEQQGWTLRSGGADGADQAFEAGVEHAAEIYLPWLGFNGSKSKLLPTRKAFALAERFHPAWDRLSRAAKALHARNSHQVLGASLRSPSKLVICWTPDGGSSGGTGQALRIAAQYGIPIFNLFDSKTHTRLTRFVDS